MVIGMVVMEEVDQDSLFGCLLCYVLSYLPIKDVVVLCFKLCTYQRRRRKPESVILTDNIIGWRNNWKTATSHYATCGHSVVVESCAACRLQTEVFAVLETFVDRLIPNVDIRAFTVRELIPGCYPHLTSPRHT